MPIGTLGSICAFASSRGRLLAGLITTALSVGSAAQAAELRLSSMFSDHAVLQQGRAVPVWGWAGAGESVRVEFAGQRVQTRADRSGRWAVELASMPATFEPRELVVSSEQDRLALRDILVGEVWFVSGQSNMEWRLVHTDHGAEALDNADVPGVRLFLAAIECAAEPQADAHSAWRVEGRDSGWQPSTRWSANRFGAVGFHFAVELRRRLDRPVGVIQAAVGGSRIEAWTPREAFAQNPSFAADLAWLRAAEQAHRDAELRSLAAYETWLRAARASKRGVPDPPEWPRHPGSWFNKPTCFYNGMVNGLAPYGIRGMLWYQGESNVPEGAAYAERLRAFMGSMRRAWRQDALPIALVQLAPYDRADAAGMPRVWQAQLEAGRTPHTGLITISDLVTDTSDLHPSNKRDVGLRAADWAVSTQYGQPGTLPSGPLYRSMRGEGSKIRLSFDHARGLASRDGHALDGFEIAGADRAFVRADAVIDGDEVIVSSRRVAQPVAVRFAWDRAARPNLVNEAGFPAASFRTDTWP